MRKQAIIKLPRIWRSCRPEISTDQPIAKKLPQITKGFPYCMRCSPVLLKIPMSQFIMVELFDENMLFLYLSASIFRILLNNFLTS
jgi:hypothetical protein